MECFGTPDFDNNSRLITLSAIIISSLHCITELKSIAKLFCNGRGRWEDTMRNVHFGWRRRKKREEGEQTYCNKYRNIRNRANPGGHAV
jgi:hypothetical protein